MSLVLNITDDSFETEVLKSEIPVLIDFWAEWCGPCKVLGPIIDDVAPEFEGKVKFTKINIDEEDATNTISNVLEGTTRTLSGQLSIDELFHNREAFRDKIVTEIEQELGEIGLEVITANIKEMGDSDQNNLYFTYRKQRATESANHQARIDVAEAKKTGEIGVAAREGEIRIKTAAIDENCNRR